VLELIGDTALVEIRRLGADVPARVLGGSVQIPAVR
jgi:hypothetical protein